MIRFAEILGQSKMAAYAIRQMAYEECHKKTSEVFQTSEVSLIIIKGMFHLTCHERVRVFFEDSQAGAGAEVDRLTAIFRVGIPGWVFEGSPTSSLMFRQ
jgi:hypothetical protein